MNPIHIVAALPALVVIATLIFIVIQFRKINAHHKRFKLADADCTKAIEMMKASKNEQQFRLRQQRVEECLENMESIMKER